MTLLSEYVYRWYFKWSFYMKYIKIIALTLIIIGTESVYVPNVFAATKNIANITSDGSSQYETEVAADKDWIAYEKIQYPENVRTIVVKNIKNGTVKTVESTNDTRSHNINISNNKVTYELADNLYARVYVYDINTGTKKAVSGEFDAFESNTDGENVSYIGFKNSHRDLFVYNISTGVAQQITDDYDQESDSSISGNLIALAKYSNGHRNVFIYNLTTRQFNQISSLSEDVFMPKIRGNDIVWHTNSKVYAYSLVTGVTSVLYDGSFNDPYYAFPTSTSISEGKIGYTVTEAVNSSSLNSVFVYDIDTNSSMRVAQSNENMDVATSQKQVVYVGGTYTEDTRDIYAQSYKK